jgi:hypothetical protein
MKPRRQPCQAARTCAAGVSHLVIAIGGNDAFQNGDLLLETPVSSTAAALALFGDRVDRFENAYRAAIDAALAMVRDTNRVHDLQRQPGGQGGASGSCRPP